MQETTEQFKALRVKELKERLEAFDDSDLVVLRVPGKYSRYCLAATPRQTFGMKDRETGTFVHAMVDNKGYEELHPGVEIYRMLLIE